MGHGSRAATFTNETATGWQQVDFGVPVPIAANTTYIASYFAPFGHYAFNAGYFTTGVDQGPLHALANAVSPNGVFGRGTSSVFPDQTYNATNYWVDVVFLTSLPPDNTPPTVTSTQPAAGADAVALSGVGHRDLQ